MSKPKFNKILLDDIYSVLANSEFGIDSFEITFPEKGKILLRVVFRPDRDYELVIQYIGGDPNKIASLEKPGEYLVHETHGGLGFGDIDVRLQHWVDNVAEELRSSGTRPEGLGELSEQLEQWVSDNVQEPNENFSDQEISDLVDRLNKLEQRFAELEISGVFTTNQKSEISIQIENAARDLPEFKKGIWYRVSLSKIFKTVKSVLSSHEAREIMKEAAKKLLDLG